MRGVWGGPLFWLEETSKSATPSEIFFTSSRQNSPIHRPGAPKSYQDAAMTTTMQEHSSRIDPALVSAYRETEFRVFGETPFAMRVDQSCLSLACSLLAHRVDCAAFISAANPYSRQSPDLGLR